MTIVGLIALAVTAVWFGGILWRIDNWGRDWSQNHASISPTAKDPQLKSPTFTDNPGAVVKRIEAWAAEQPRWTVESTTAHESSVTLQLTRKTRIFRFADDISVRLERTDEGTQLTAESQSRVGKGDLGQNPRNLRELLDGLR